MSKIQYESAPAAPEMSRWGVDTPLRPQPKLPGNCCVCCSCCGAPPSPIDTKNILRDGGKYVQLSDGRIVEYFVYGSEATDARVLVQINGSMGTGWMFGQFPASVQKLKELNVKGLSITVPGHGYSSAQAGRKIGDWAKDDVEPVLMAEGVTGLFMVEGTSFGSSHAMAVAAHFGERVSALHLHVPYLPLEMRREMGWDEYGQEDALKCEPAWASSCCSCSFCIFCLCGTMACCHKNSPSAFADEHTKKLDAEVPGTLKIINEDVDRSAAMGVYGWVHNALVPTTSANWGFNPREIKTQKVIISYAEDDVQSPGQHGKWLSEFFTQNAATSKVNVGSGMGHAQHQVKMVNGDFISQIAMI
eukprot:gene19113-22854_t